MRPSIRELNTATRRACVTRGRGQCAPFVCRVLLKYLRVLRATRRLRGHSRRSLQARGPRARFSKRMGGSCVGHVLPSPHIRALKTRYLVATFGADAVQLAMASCV